MPVFEADAFDRHEQIVFAADPDTGLKAIIAIHDTRRGPALGGCRYWYYDDERAALTDVLRLSRGMTYKATMAGLPYGGGKSVILADPARPKTPELMRALGRAVDRLSGRYVVAEDVGTSPADMAEVRRETAHVAGLAEGGGDPSPATAYGVWRGIHAAVNHRLRRNALEGLTVAVQGLGHVGYHLCRHLHQEGARLYVTDIRRSGVERAVRDFGAIAVDADAIYDVDADVFAPCALGAVINDNTAGRLRASVVAGSANNQLAAPRHGALLADRAILYAPDYVINAGGLINVHHERSGAYDRDTTYAHVAGIERTLADVFARAARDGVPTDVAADRMAEERLKAA
ncbi:Glu/Leu/Phe/Val family dehydrogenase [Azospirillum halopraeferens]|uniref:Glu/Leu/Phe/Val family dehydrogenase n=1 Tax=Azospirillum halopraeferens TaxID=34010 RepID=UPI00040DE72B|nr:Glu/Leu/Phe/Val dehydrogenase [Azospirillum halopraeferens]